MTIALHKPYGVLCRFTDDEGRPTLRDCVDLPGVYPVGRLDLDSEGLLLLSDEPRVTTQLTRPGGHWKSYWVQVERVPGEEALAALPSAYPVRARLIDPPIGPRVPPIRYRKSVPDQWLELQIQEGKNRQVRRMTAAIGHPTLRLVRHRIGEIDLGRLPAGRWRHLTEPELAYLRSL